MLRAIVLSGLAAALTCVAACSGPASTGPSPVPATATSVATTTSAAPAVCSNLFETGQLVKPELADVQCTDPTGLAVNHKVVCKNGEVMVFDSALKVYGWPGKTFQPMDTDADSTYAKDYRTCLSG